MSVLPSGSSRSPSTEQRGGPDRLRPILAGIALAAYLLYLTLTPMPPFAADVYGSLLRRHIFGSLVLLGLVGWLATRRRLPTRTPFALPLAAVTLALLIGVARSASPRVSLEAVLLLLPALPLYVLLAEIPSFTPRVLAWSVLASATIAAGFALASIWSAWTEWLGLLRAIGVPLTRDSLLPPATPRVAGVGSHPNILGSVLAISLPVAPLLWREPGARAGRVVVGGAVTLILAALFFTQSRAAWAGAVAGLALGALLLAPWARLRARPTVLTVAMAGAAATLLLGVVLVAGGAGPDFLFRDSLGSRADLRRAGFAMFRAQPLTGLGPGLFAAYYPLYGGAYPFAAVHTHNIVVQTAVDTGLVGLAAGSSLVGVVVWVGVRALRRGGVRRATAATALAMLTALGVDALADSPQLFPEAGLLAMTALVMLVRASDGLPALNRVRRLPGVRTRLAGGSAHALALLLCVALPLAWLYTDRAHAAASAGLAAARRGDWPEAVRRSQQAVARDPRMPAYWLQLGAAHASAAINGDREAEQRMALGATGRGLELESHNGAAVVNYAALNVALGRPEQARETLPTLARLAGRDTLLLLAHATMIQWTAPPEQAVEQYAGLLVINPTLAATPFWQDGGFRQANLDRIVNRAVERAPEVAGTGPAAESLRAAINLYAGRAAPSLAVLEAERTRRPDDVSLIVATAKLLAPTDRPRARALLERAVRLQRDDAAAHAALADLIATDPSASPRDTERVRREYATAAYLGDVEAAVKLGASFEGGPVPRAVAKRAERQLQAAELTRFYLIFQTYRFTFQRAEAIPIILPGDWLLALPADLPRWKAAVEGWEKR